MEHHQAETIGKYLKSLHANDWKKLFDLIPRIQQATIFCRWDEMEKTDKKSREIIYDLSYTADEAVILDFRDVMDDLNLHIAFQWPEWKEGKQIIQNGDFSDLDTITLLKILSTFLRNDRFCTGALAGAFDDGIIEKVLVQIRNNVVAEKDFDQT